LHVHTSAAELVMAASEDEVAAQVAAANASNVCSFTRKRSVRKPWPEDSERERVVLVVAAPGSCARCGGSPLSKLGEDVTETRDEIPLRFKVIETVCEKFTCRDCEAISGEQQLCRQLLPTQQSRQWPGCKIGPKSAPQKLNAGL
jgi:hypothetical protein